MNFKAKAFIEAIMALLGMFIALSSLVILIGNGLALLLMAGSHSEPYMLALFFSSVVSFLFGFVVFMSRAKLANRISPWDSEVYVHPQSLVAVGAAVIGVLFMANGLLSVISFFLVEVPMLDPSVIVRGSGLPATLDYEHRMLLLSGVPSMCIGVALFVFSAKIGGKWLNLQGE